MYVLEDNEAVIKMIIKGRSPTMRHVPEPTELLLIGCSIELIWTPKSKSNLSNCGNWLFLFWKQNSDYIESGATCYHWQKSKISRECQLNNSDSVPSNVQSSRQEALLYVFEENEAVIKMFLKERSPTMRHVSRDHKVALDWLFDRIKLDPKIQIKQVHRHQKPTRRHANQMKFHAWWVESFVVLVQYQPFQFFSVLWYNGKTISTRIREKNELQQKSRPMMNLIVKTPSFVSSSTSVSPGKRNYGNQNPWNPIAKKVEKSGRPDHGTDQFKASDRYYHENFLESFSSASYSKCDDGRAWFSQVWKTEATAPQLSCSIDSILEDEELMKMHVDLQKRFPIYHVCSRCSGGPPLRRGDIYEGKLHNPFKYPMRWEWHCRTGNVGISTANWFVIPENP